MIKINLFVLGLSLLTLMSSVAMAGPYKTRPVWAAEPYSPLFRGGNGLKRELTARSSCTYVPMSAAQKRLVLAMIFVAVRMDMQGQYHQTAENFFKSVFRLETKAKEPEAIRAAFSQASPLPPEFAGAFLNLRNRWDTFTACRMRFLIEVGVKKFAKLYGYDVAERYWNEAFSYLSPDTQATAKSLPFGVALAGDLEARDRQLFMDAFLELVRILTFQHPQETGKMLREFSIERGFCEGLLARASIALLGG